MGNSRNNKSNDCNGADDLSLLYKLLDDKQIQQERVNRELGLGELKNPDFHYGKWHNPYTNEDVDGQSLRWSNFKQLEPSEMLRKIQRDVFPFIKNINSGDDSAYSRFMANANFLILTPRALVRIVDGIDKLQMTDKDIMGDVYEYILDKMASKGDNGQFRTPRHIIRMMVELMKPSLNDTVCDPAMGSAGFIVETAEYVKKHYTSELMKESNARHFVKDMLHGYDNDQTMMRIGAMNLMLHDISHPDVEFLDSLSTDNKDKNKYTLILANPPFSGTLDKEVVSPSLLTIADTGKTEILFLSLFLRTLSMGCRCASIVPDGILNSTSNAHQAIRKALIDDNRLEAVISLPAGVFNPYSNVSTAILIFTKTGSGGTDKVWFYDMKADGFSLEKNREPIQENDIPDVISRFNNLENEVNRSQKEQSFMVPLKEIQDNQYDLSFNTYKETIREKVNFEKPSSILKRVSDRFDEIFNEVKNLKSLISENNEA